MVIEINRYKCGYCGGCVSVCSENAIELVETFIEIDEDRCISCKKCENFCPVGSIKVIL